MQRIEQDPRNPYPGAIAGAAAEAFWGIPKQIVEEGDKFLTNEIREVVRRFYEQTGASTVI